MHAYPCQDLSGDIGVLDMGFLSVIRRWALKDKMPIREIARRTGLSRNTIKTCLRGEIGEPSFQAPPRRAARQHKLACVRGEQAGSVCRKAVRLAGDETAQIAQRTAHRQADAF